MSGDAREPFMLGWNEWLRDAEAREDEMPPVDEWWAIWNSGTTVDQAIRDYKKPVDSADVKMSNWKEITR